MKRVFLIILDSFGIGGMEDAPQYGDLDVNTLRSVSSSPSFHLPNMAKLGLFHIEGVREGLENAGTPAKKWVTGLSHKSYMAAIARMTEASKGKDTTIGHWEIAGIYSGNPLPVYPDGFPEDILDQFSQKTGREVLCNRPYSGTEVIQKYGDEHVKTGKLIVYTSADSVFQIAAHTDVVPVEELYHYCEIARSLLQGEHGVGRVIARPFSGETGNYTRTSDRHDFSLLPPGVTMLDQLKEKGYQVISVGKIKDIFAGQGITEAIPTKGNAQGIETVLSLLDQDFEGLCFTNLVDYDMLYGHRNDIDGYAGALTFFDEKLPEILHKMRKEDILMITADHGCDPGYLVSTDHSREYTPFLMYGKAISPINFGTRKTFADIGATVLQYFGINPAFAGEGMLHAAVNSDACNTIEPGGDT